MVHCARWCNLPTHKHQRDWAILGRKNCTGWDHRHLREIDCSLAVVGGPVAGAESVGKSIHWTHTWLQKVLHSGCCSWRHNYCSQQRQVGRANEQSTSLRCLWLGQILPLLPVYFCYEWVTSATFHFMWTNCEAQTNQLST